jgi:hypothetical protein
MQGYFCSAQLPFALFLEALVEWLGIHSSDLAILHKIFLPSFLDSLQLLQQLAVQSFEFELVQVE